MARPPESTKTSLRQRLAARARERWPQLAGITVRYHGEFAYVAGQLPDGTTLPLCRLRYAGSATTWGFAIYRASHDDYEKSVLPSGYPAGTPQEALDCACGLYLGDTTAWLNPPTPDELTGAPTSGPLLARFESMSRTWTGTSGVAVSSGSVALEIALRILDVAGGTVLIPVNTFFATAAAAGASVRRCVSLT